MRSSAYDFLGTHPTRNREHKEALLCSEEPGKVEGLSEVQLQLSLLTPDGNALTQTSH